MKHKEIFPSLLITDEFLTEEEAVELREKVDYAERNIEGVIVSNANGWHSPKNVFVNFDQEYDQYYKDKIIEKLIKSLSSYYDNDERILNQDNWDVEYWVNVNRGGGYNKSHDHSDDNHWSGVAYLTDLGEIAESEGRLYVQDKILNSKGDYTWRIPQLKGSENNPEIPVKHEYGKIVIFPGTLWHRVERISDAVGLRISIAFNATNSHLTNGFNNRSLKNKIRRDLRLLAVFGVKIIRFFKKFR